MINVKTSDNAQIVGLMSGTSLDGLDLVLCSFHEREGGYAFDIHGSKALEYNDGWRSRLGHAHLLPEMELMDLDRSYGRFLGEETAKFLEENGLKADLIASHGHTVRHEPEKGITLQIGNGRELAGVAGINVVNDFRTQDVELGGQGAPLVPIGDRLLFNEYDACINLGGFANISYEQGGKRRAYDICPLNIVLNEQSEKLGHAYDAGGAMARDGDLVPELLKALQGLDFYTADPPKSLAREWVEECIHPLIRPLAAKDVLRTFTEHAALQIARSIDGEEHRSVLFTGGGSYNEFLMERVRAHCRSELLIPNSVIVDFKEAIVFAFLAYLYMNGIPNVLSSVTGASEDHVAGVLWKTAD
jgi:anhydro-N-acetylmuramic acid kinase